MTDFVTRKKINVWLDKFILINTWQTVKDSSHSTKIALAVKRSREASIKGLVKDYTKKNAMITWLVYLLNNDRYTLICVALHIEHAWLEGLKVKSSFEDKGAKDLGKVVRDPCLGIGVPLRVGKSWPCLGQKPYPVRENTFNTLYKRS